MRRLRVALLALALLLALAAGALLVVVRHAERRPLPRLWGEVRVQGLDGPVDVVRDSRGIPHVYATTPHDLFLGQGYVHGQDRFFQMDFFRHVGEGRLAELFGADLVETDAFIRTLGWGRVAAAQLEAASEEDRRILEAYAAGVNAYRQGREPADLALEYAVLGLRGELEPPEPWDPRHSLTWGLVMAWDLAGNMDQEIERALLLGDGRSREQVDQLLPAYPYGRNPTILPGGEGAPRSAPPADAAALDALRRASARVAALDAVAGGGLEGIGSNNWVLSGRRTKTGRPLLANDPHLGIQIPSIWYQVGLHCAPVSAACPYDVVGFSFAGVPGVIIGHNARIAWGITNLGPDVMDLYVERLDPDDPSRYEVDGAFRRMGERRETIRVAGGEPVELTVRTTRHGPVVSEAYGPLEGFGRRAGIEVPERYAVALRWTALEARTSTLAAFRGIDLARGWSDFREALRHFPGPSQSFVYADVEGRIGYQAPGDIPIRRAGDGRYPVPGWTSDHEWEGLIDFDALPSVLDPEAGYVVTANNAVVGPGFPHDLGSDWSYGYRARRIVDLIEARETHGLEDLAAMQLDSYDLNAERVLPYLARLHLGEEGPEVVLRTLAGWDHRAERGSPGAAAFAAVWRHLLALAFADDMPPGRRGPYGGSRWFTVVDGLLDRPDDPLWDDRRTERVEGRDDILAAAVRAAWSELRASLGPSPGRWSWGRLHRADFVHKTLGRSGIAAIERVFNRPGPGVSGGTSLVCATGWDAAEGYGVDWLPSMRMVVDLGDLSRSVTVHTTGQSGHPASPHYDDMISLWASGRSYPMLFRRPEVEADAEGTLRLVP